MKTFILTLLSLGSVSAFSGTSDFCLTKERLIPYSIIWEFSTICDGVKLKQSGISKEKTKIKFEKVLKLRGYSNILRSRHNTVISKDKRSSLPFNEICLVTRDYRAYIECEGSPTVILNTSKNSDIVQFAKSYNYKVLKIPQKKIDFFILGR